MTMMSRLLMEPALLLSRYAERLLDKKPGRVMFLQEKDGAPAGVTKVVTAMPGQIGQTSLSGYRILVIEDEYFLAEDICTALKELGADILGPVGEVGDAIGIVNSGQVIDGAVVDINLRGESIYPVAESLRARTIPFVFTSGYDKNAIESRFRDIELFEKPINAAAMARSLGRLIDGAGRALFSDSP